MLKHLITLVTATSIPVGATWYTPALMEDQRTPCGALEQILLRKKTIAQQDASVGAWIGYFVGGMLSEISSGELTKEYMRQEYPNSAPVLACSMAYWELYLDGNSDEPHVSAPPTLTTPAKFW